MKRKVIFVTDFIVYIQSVLLGIVEGLPEWLPVSSTGHMILLDEIFPMNVTEDFKNLFLVLVQIGAILAVVVQFFSILWPLKKEEGKIALDMPTMKLWGKIVISCVPAAIVGVLFDDMLEALFYNWYTVALMLVVFGVLFLVVDRENGRPAPRCDSIHTLTIKDAVLIGLFQLIAAVFPGTSRSGATIVGALMLGVSRTAAAEYTFCMGVPVMLGAGLLKLLKFGLDFTATEFAVLMIGMVTAFVVSLLVIRFLMGYIKKHSFQIFGWYRIALGIVVSLYFLLVG